MKTAVPEGVEVLTHTIDVALRSCNRRTAIAISIMLVYNSLIVVTTINDSHSRSSSSSNSSSNSSSSSSVIAAVVVVVGGDVHSSPRSVRSSSSYGSSHRRILGSMVMMVMLTREVDDGSSYLNSMSNCKAYHSIQETLKAHAPK